MAFDKVWYNIRQIVRLSSIEKDLRKKGISLVAGVDEAGRGPLAGPVFAAAVILPEKPVINGLDDSKKLSPKARETLFELIVDKALCVGVGRCEPDEIDRINILQATFKAMLQAVLSAGKVPGMVLVDGNRTIPGLDLPQRAIIKGDATCRCIAAASIVAKVLRDRHMKEIDRVHPGYGFCRHKGYGTAAHMAAIASLGPCVQHRKSFLKNILR